MNIIETQIADVTKDNIDKSKEALANSIIYNVYPVFNEVYTSRIEEINELKKILEEKKEEVKNSKEHLETLVNNYKIKKKIYKLLERIEKLISSGLTYDGTIKHEMVVLLKIVNKLSEDKIDYHLKNTLQMISKRFSR